MKLRTRLIATSLLLAAPPAIAAPWVIHRVRQADLSLAAVRVVQSQVNDQNRERCESDPTWFFTGPLEGRPPRGIFVERSPDELPPRPRISPQPFELFAYDERFLGSSAAAPSFPPDFRRALRASSAPAIAPFATGRGTGMQAAVPTGWIGGPCMYFLARMRPPDNQRSLLVAAGLGTFAVVFAVAFLAGVPVMRRVQRLSRDQRESVAADYSAIAPDKLRDELSALTFMFNDAATELHQRKTRIEDQNESLRRFVRSTEDEIARPLEALTRTLGTVSAGASGSAIGAIRDAAAEAHDLSARVDNLVAAARLRLSGAAIPAAPVDLAALVRRVVDKERASAEARGVTLEAVVRDRLEVQADAVLLERAIANLVDNAIRYNRAGGRVAVALESLAGPRFELRIADTGSGVSDEEFRGLATPRRFRGDEGRNRRPGTRGLGLSVSQEVADRFGMALEFRRSGPEGTEVLISGPSS
jgi:signal transduction histidine kinase